MVSLPEDVRISAEEGERRLDQLAQVLCGCWVVSLSNAGVSRLLGVIMAGDECLSARDRDGQRRAATGSGG